MKKTLRNGALFCMLALIGLVIAGVFTGCAEPEEKSSKKDILSFAINGIEGVIYGGEFIDVVLPAGTNVTSLTPDIKVSKKAKVVTKGARDFTNPVNYVVKAENGSTKYYAITVEVVKPEVVIPSDKNNILKFTLGGVEGIILGNSITVTLPAGTDVKALTPVIELSANATVTPAAAARDFTKPVNYMVTAEDGSIVFYIVTVNVEEPDNSGTLNLTVGLVDKEAGIVIHSQVNGVGIDGLLDQTKDIKLSLSGDNGPTSITLSFNKNIFSDNVRVWLNGSQIIGYSNYENIVTIGNSRFMLGRPNYIYIEYTADSMVYSTELTIVVEE